MVLGRGRAPAHAGRGFMNRILIVSDDIFLRDMVRLSLIDMRTRCVVRPMRTRWKGFAAAYCSIW